MRSSAHGRGDDCAAYTLGTDRRCIGGALYLPVGHSLHVDRLGRQWRKPQQMATLSVSPTGDVRIAQEAIADFCVQTAKQVEGVQSAQCKLMQKEVGITILMTLLAGVESNLVDLAATVQGRIKQMLEASCGITDAAVEVLFEKKA